MLAGHPFAVEVTSYAGGETEFDLTKELALGGTYRLIVNGVQTAALNYDADADAIEAALAENLRQ